MPSRSQYSLHSPPNWVQALVARSDCKQWMRLLCVNKIYDVAVSHQLTAERTGYQFRGRVGGGDYTVPAPHFTFCILAEIFAHTSKLSWLLCHVQHVQKVSFSDSTSFSTCCPPLLFMWPVSSFFVLFFVSFFPSSLLVLFNVHLILLHPQFTILLALTTCNLQFELLTASLNKPYTKYLDKDFGRILLQGGAHYLCVE